jgi:hypothetical protein
MDNTKNQDVGWSVTSYKDHYPTAGAKASAEMPQTRRILSEMAKDSRQRGLLPPNDTSVRHHPFIRNRRSGPSNSKRLSSIFTSLQATIRSLRNIQPIHSSCRFAPSRRRDSCTFPPTVKSLAVVVSIHKFSHGLVGISNLFHDLVAHSDRHFWC